MLLYDPLHGDARTTQGSLRPRTCFLMTKLAAPIPGDVERARRDLTGILAEHGYSVVDAESRVTGRDFLLKVWEYTASVPVGVAIVYSGMPRRTMGNIYYELGMLTALGKETLVIRVGNPTIASDLVRSEWINYDARFSEKLRAYLRELGERAEYFITVAEQGQCRGSSSVVLPS